MVYTTVTFAPVQGFIEKSRKLRDLYGSSFILSYLSRAVCDAAKADGHVVISPALISVTQGTPNQIVIRGNFSEVAAHEALLQAWKAVVDICREEVERRLPENSLPSGSRYSWKRVWDAWGNHAWEFFYAQANSITAARSHLNETKRSRAWTGINWHGESSTLSGADAIAWYGMAEKMHPKDSAADQHDKIKKYCELLSKALTEEILDPTEQLSIPELIKRVLLLDEVVKTLNRDDYQGKIPKIEAPKSFRSVNRYDGARWTGWFQGDGDSIGNFLRSLKDAGEDEENALSEFSSAMMEWGKNFPSFLGENIGRIIYAGGDDFLGILFRNAPAPALDGQEILDWFYKFPEIWQRHKRIDSSGKLLTVSVGLVWAAPNIPQRDILQHCKDAEQAAKRGGRDRLCLRVLFNGGNYLEWICPWWFLDVMQEYRDRDHKQGQDANWGHLFEDIATLEARHALTHQSDVSLALFALYFGDARRQQLETFLWSKNDKTGILGHDASTQDETQRLNDWICNLAKVGFHLHRQKAPINQLMLSNAV